MLERRDAAPVGKMRIRAGFDERPHGLDVPRAAVAQDYRLDQRGPAEIVDVIERSACRNEFAHDLVAKRDVEAHVPKLAHY